MKLTDMLISAIIKKGILYEARNVDMEISVPMSAISTVGETTPVINEIRVYFKAEHMTLRIEKTEEEA